MPHTQPGAGHAQSLTVECSQSWEEKALDGENHPMMRWLILFFQSPGGSRTTREPLTFSCSSARHQPAISHPHQFCLIEEEVWTACCLFFSSYKDTVGLRQELLLEFNIILLSWYLFYFPSPPLSSTDERYQFPTPGKVVSPL